MSPVKTYKVICFRLAVLGEMVFLFISLSHLAIIIYSSCFFQQLKWWTPALLSAAVVFRIAKHIAVTCWSVTLQQRSWQHISKAAHCDLPRSEGNGKTLWSAAAQIKQWREIWDVAILTESITVWTPEDEKEHWEWDIEIRIPKRVLIFSDIV